MSVSDDVKAKMKLSSELSNRDGGEYIKFTGMNMDFAVGKGKIKLDNLFGGDKLIGEELRYIFTPVEKER